MTAQIPEGCVPLQSRVDNLTFQWHQLQEQLAGADPSDVVRTRNLVGKKERELQVAKSALQTCIDNPPPRPTPPPLDTIPGVPDACVAAFRRIEKATVDFNRLKDQLDGADPSDKERISNLKGAAERALSIAKFAYKACLDKNSEPAFYPAPSATIPVISTDITPTPVTKIISWKYLQKKMDEFFNKRTDPPILKFRVHHHDTPQNDQPATDLTFSMIEAGLINGQVTTDYKPMPVMSMGQLPFGLYFSDFNMSSINFSFEPSSAAPITVKISFECGGAEEIKSTRLLIPNVNLSQFDISLKLSFDVVKGLTPPQCLSMESDLDSMNLDMADLQRELQNQNTNHALLAKQINDLSKQIQVAKGALQTCIATFGGANSSGFGRLEFFSWTDKIKELKDDAFDNALKNFVVDHIVTDLPQPFDVDGTIRKAIREGVFNKLKDLATKTKVSSAVSNWILGGTGTFNVLSCVSDAENITIKYLVPKNKLDPFPDSMFRPAGWPFQGNPTPDPAFDFSIPSNLSNIKHIVVLTMENRSFDHMLGYLSLPVTAGGAGRTDVDGLNGSKPNPYNLELFPSVPIAAGDTAFGPDPSHSYEPVYHQINAEVDDITKPVPLPIPGKGKMNGFVKAFVNSTGSFNGAAIMGYHTAANVPVYDALARDFGISHRWFASHPGPTFCNRFYEITGRLNLGSGLNTDTPPIAENMWEFSNSSPLTPVFNKTIFDYLTDYHNQFEKGVTWKYYEEGYCFLRFFSNYTFDNTNVVSMNDPVNGFFADAKNGTLPSVSYIDPHFIELPPNANCDGPVADIKLGQALVQKVVEAVVSSPNYASTLLVITYDEHGGFYDHVPPPAAVPFSNESPIKTYGVRVPAFFISPWIKPGAVFGHAEDASGKTLYFDHTSILKTIARRFMSRNPPYMGARYAAANDLTSILNPSIFKPLFLPFVKHKVAYNPNNMRLNIEGGTATSAVTARFDSNDSDAQRFSFEQFGDFLYIRTMFGSNYLTVDIPDGNTTMPAAGYGIKQAAKYEGGQALIDPVKFNLKYQLWHFAPLDATDAGKNLFTVTNPFFPKLVLRPMDLLQNATPLVLGNIATASPNVWSASSTAIH